MATTIASFQGFWRVSGESIGFADHVTPRRPLEYLSHRGGSNAKSGSYCAAGHSGLSHSPRRPNPLGVHFGVMMRNAYDLSVSALGHFVVAVVLRRPRKEMVRVHTGWRVASVKDQMSVRDGAGVMGVAHTVSEPDFSVQPVLAVTTDIGGRPKPAPARGFVDLGPKSIFKHGLKNACMTPDSQGSVPHF